MLEVVGHVSSRNAIVRAEGGLVQDHIDASRSFFAGFIKSPTNDGDVRISRYQVGLLRFGVFYGAEGIDYILWRCGAPFQTSTRAGSERRGRRGGWGGICGSHILAVAGG